MDKRVTISLDKELYERLKARAEVNKRSLKAQIEWEIQQANRVAK